MELLDTKSLMSQIFACKKELFHLRMKKATEGLKDTSVIKKNRKKVASLYTRLNSRSSKSQSK